MVDFSAYNGNFVQMFMSALNQCESAGITDIRFVRQQMQWSMNGRFRAAEVKKLAARREVRKAIRAYTPRTCPECGRQMKNPVSMGGMILVGCPCGYSEVLQNV